MNAYLFTSGVTLTWHPADRTWTAHAEIGDRRRFSSAPSVGAEIFTQHRHTDPREAVLAVQAAVDSLGISWDYLMNGTPPFLSIVGDGEDAPVPPNWRSVVRLIAAELGWETYDAANDST